MTPDERHTYQVDKDRFIHVRKVAKGFRKMSKRYHKEKAAGTWKALPELTSGNKKSSKKPASTIPAPVAQMPTPSTSVQAPPTPAAAPAATVPAWNNEAMKLLSENNKLLKYQTTLLKDIRNEFLYFNRQIHDIRSHFGMS